MEYPKVTQAANGVVTRAYDYGTGNYLLLTGGTLTGALSGTSATFNQAVSVLSGSPGVRRRLTLGDNVPRIVLGVLNTEMEASNLIGLADNAIDVIVYPRVGATDGEKGGFQVRTYRSGQTVYHTALNLSRDGGLTLSGDLIFVPPEGRTLSLSGQMAFERVSNTELNVVHRGLDGVVRKFPIAGIGSTPNLPLITGVSGVITAGAWGTAANTFCQGNDTRLDDAVTAKTRTDTGHIPLILEGDGAPLPVGVLTGQVYVPFNCTITGWELVANESGTIEIEILKDTFANWPPTSGDPITGTAHPGLTATNKANSTTLTGWVTALNLGDYIKVEILSNASITNALLVLKVARV